MTVRSERAPRARPRAVDADPAAHGGPARADRDRPRPDPPEPASAAAALRRGGIGDPDRERARARHPPADPRHRDDRWLSARRGRASAARGRRGGLERIPAVVRQLDDQTQLEVALIENLQREDLDAIEAARGFRRLIDEFGFSPELIAARVGRARSTVANTLRLLELAPSVQTAVADRRITEGHARALGGLSVDHQDHVLGTVIEQDLSVRQTEELVRRLREPRAGATGAVRGGVPECRSRPRTGGGGPPPRPRHEGEPRPLAPRRPDRDRVLQR